MQMNSCLRTRALSHHLVFVSAQPPPSQQSWRNPRSYNSPPRRDSRECFYCHESGHLISACPSLNEETWKDAPKQRSPKGSGFVCPVGQLHGETDPVFDPFISKGMVSLTGREEDKVAVQILRDTGSAQSFILASALPFSEESYCESDVLVQGIEMRTLKLPLHTVYVQSKLMSGFVKVAICSQLPMDNIHLIIGNELAHERVLPRPEGVSFVLSSESSGKAARRSLFTAVGAESSKSFLSLPVDREMLKKEQRNDSSLARCRATAA